jgi:hypothetical protein
VDPTVVSCSFTIASKFSASVSLSLSRARARTRDLSPTLSHNRARPHKQQVFVSCLALCACEDWAKRIMNSAVVIRVCGGSTTSRVVAGSNLVSCSFTIMEWFFFPSSPMARKT